MSAPADPEPANDGRNDPVMTLFVVGVLLMLAICLLLLLIANGRRPAGL